MDFKEIRVIRLKDKDVCFFLKEGIQLNYENIVDVVIRDRPERSKREDSCKHSWLKERGNSCFEWMRCGALNSQETD